MAVITKPDVTEMKRGYFQLGQGKEEFKGLNPSMHGGQLLAVFQAIEDDWNSPAHKTSLKADMDAAAGKTLTNSQAKVLGRAWLKFKAKRGG